MPTALPQDRLVRKEVALGVVREFEPPQDHIGTRLIAPMQEVQSDDVLFAYTRGMTAGLAPARAEDAESELAGKDESVGTGTASVIDWAIKDHYDASDVTRWREGQALLANPATLAAFPLLSRQMTEGFNDKRDNDTLRRRRKLDNRIEWLIMTGLDTGKITYNDGKIAFSVDYGRPAAQQDIATPTSGNLWGAANSDPIADITVVQELAYPMGVNLDRCIISRKALRKLYMSPKFTDALTGADPRYKVMPWGPQQAADFIEAQTNMTFIVYDSVYRTRSLGSNTTVNTRFTREDYAIFLPSNADVEALSDMVGFGATLTSPHPEGNWQAGFYEWERETVDPWGHDMGTGVKAFPVLPHLDLTWVMKVI